MELSEDLQEQIGNWSVSQAADEDMEPQTYYDCVLATAPGWKVGGWPSWGPTDPQPRPCPTCGSEMDALLAIATSEEGGDDARSWFPYGDPATEAAIGFDPRRPTAVQIGRSYDQQLYICPAAPEHPHIELMQ